MKNKGLSLIETLIALIISGAVGASFIKYQIENSQNLQVKLLSNQLNQLISGIDQRISIDGYDYNLWNKKSWNNNEIKDLIKNQLQAINSQCHNGSWNPINGNKNLSLVDCSLFDNRIFDINLEANLIKDPLTNYIQSFNFDIYFKNNDEFKINFPVINKSFKYAKANAKESLTGTHFFQYVDRNTNNIITMNQCIRKAENCAFRLSLNRQGGVEYLKIDGSNSMINSNITFIDTRGNAPLKCIKWSKQNNGIWTKHIDESCGIGLYKKTNTPVTVDIAAKNGTFENISLSKNCRIFNYINNQVVDSDRVLPCGISENNNIIVQLVDNIYANNGYFKNIYANDMRLNNLNSKNIISDRINVSYLDVANNLNVSGNIKTKDLNVTNSLDAKNIKASNIQVTNINSNQNIMNSLQVRGNSQLNTLSSSNINTNNLVSTNARSVNSVATHKMAAPIGEFDNIKFEMNKLSNEINKLNNKFNQLPIQKKLTWKKYGTDQRCGQGPSFSHLVKLGAPCSNKYEIRTWWSSNSPTGPGSAQCYEQAKAICLD